MHSQIAGYYGQRYDGQPMVAEDKHAAQQEEGGTSFSIDQQVYEISELYNDMQQNQNVVKAQSVQQNNANEYGKVTIKSFESQMRNADKIMIQEGPDSQRANQAESRVQEDQEFMRSHHTFDHSNAVRDSLPLAYPPLQQQETNNQMAFSNTSETKHSEANDARNPQLSAFQFSKITHPPLPTKENTDLDNSYCSNYGGDGANMPLRYVSALGRPTTAFPDPDQRCSSQQANFIVLPHQDADQQAYLQKNFVSRASTHLSQAHNSVVMGPGGPLSSIEAASSFGHDRMGADSSSILNLHPLTQTHINAYPSSIVNNSILSQSVNQSQILSKFETPKYPNIPRHPTAGQYPQNFAHEAPLQMAKQKSEYQAQEFQVKEASRSNHKHELPLQFGSISKADTQSLVDWVNSFDDSYCVLVNSIPDDIADGIVLSHLVGYLVCSPADRQMIFDLLNYPDQNGKVGQDKIRENFDLAYNVLKCSETYAQNLKLQFLAAEDEQQGVNPESMASGKSISEFLRGLQSLAFCQDPQGKATDFNDEAPFVSHSGVTTGNNTGLLPQSARVPEELQENPAFDSTGSALSNALPTASTLQRPMNLNGTRRAERSISTIYNAHGHLNDVTSEEEDEMARLEREEHELMLELQNVDQAVNHKKREASSVASYPLLKGQNLPEQIHQLPPNQRTGVVKGHQFNTLGAQQTSARGPATKPPVAASSYRENSLQKLRSYHESLARPLRHKQRKDAIRSKLLKKMDYANVIRRSYSRPQDSRTTDQLVIVDDAVKRTPFAAPQIIHDNFNQTNVDSYRGDDSTAKYKQQAMSSQQNSNDLRKATLTYSPSPYTSKKKQQTSVTRVGNRYSVASVGLTDASPQGQNRNQQCRVGGRQIRSSLSQGKKSSSKQPKSILVQKEARPFADESPTFNHEESLYQSKRYLQSPKRGYLALTPEKNNQMSQQLITGNQVHQVPQLDKIMKPLDGFKIKPERESRQRASSHNNSVKSPCARRICSLGSDENNDDVMSEMQTLNVRPQTVNEMEQGIQSKIEQTFTVKDTLQVKKQVIDDTLKAKILHWLINNVRLLKPMSDEQVYNLKVNLPQYCRTGVMFADLINRMASRDEVIKGICRNPQGHSLSQVQANFNKIMSYFKDYPKFCTRYLWSQDEIINGNEEVAWGFFDDIWYWSHQKLSPYDPSQKNNEQQRKIPASIPKAPLPNHFKSTYNNSCQSTDRPSKLTGRNRPPLKHSQTATNVKWGSPSNKIKSGAHDIQDNYVTVGLVQNQKQVQLELLEPRSMLKTNMVYDKRCLSARNVLNPIRAGDQKNASVGTFLDGVTSSKFNFFKTSQGVEEPKSKSRGRDKQSAKMKSPTKKPPQDRKQQLFKQHENLDLELESFALFLDEDEKQEQQNKLVAQQSEKSQKKGSHVFHHLNHVDINPEKPNFKRQRSGSSKSRSVKGPAPIAASIHVGSRSPRSAMNQRFK